MVDSVLAILAPGQGSQTPGFLGPWLEVPGVAAQLRWYSEVVGRDLVALGTTGSADDIRDTAACQPLLVAAGLATAHALLEGNDRPRYYAGHSVGELTAAALSGMISDEAALVIARERGKAMALAAAATPTGMSACLGGDPELVVAAIEAAGLTPANRNGAGQIVAAGALDALAKLPAALDGVARVIALKVAGAFHTDYMLSAQRRLESLAEVTPSHDAHVPMLSNADGGSRTSCWRRHWLGSATSPRLRGRTARRPRRWGIVQMTTWPPRWAAAKSVNSSRCAGSSAAEGRSSDRARHVRARRPALCDAG
jgi:[acyl-carrier-protein] S-malonyltransferase